MGETWTMHLAKKAHSQHRKDGGVKSLRAYIREYLAPLDCVGKCRKIVEGRYK